MQIHAHSPVRVSTVARQITNKPARNDAVRKILHPDVQPKLKVGAVNDPAEREADQIADQVMRMPAPVEADASPPAKPTTLRRMCTECEEEVQRKPDEAEASAPIDIHSNLTSDIVSRRPVFTADTDCSLDQKCEIVAAWEVAEGMVADAIAAVDDVIANGARSPRFAAVNRRFPGASAEQLRQLAVVLRSIVGELGATITTQCTSDACEGAVLAATTCNVGADVEFCSQFFIGADCRTQSAAIIHEIAHHFVCLVNPAIEVTHPETGDKERTGDVYRHFPEFGNLTADQALQNPDSYAVLCLETSTRDDCFACSFIMQTDPVAWEAARRRLERDHQAPVEEENGGAAPQQIQRKCAKCADEEVRRSQHAGNASRHQDQSTGSVTPAADRAIRNLGTGVPLSDSDKEFFEPRFGADLSNVKIHTGKSANEASSAINARAFALGNNIAFAAGEYRPGTQEGRRLMAHELVHVRQQGSGSTVRRVEQCGDDCPHRVAGEKSRSHNSPMIAAHLSEPTGGYLVWDFEVDLSDIKSGLAGDPNWRQVVHLLTTSSDMGFEILGFSDCEGSSSRNEELRAERAAALEAELPREAQSRIDRHAGAPLSDCITHNRSEGDRRLNRSAWIHLVRQNIEMDPVIVEGETKPIFICTKPIDTVAGNPLESLDLGNHAFFRIGLAATGSPTISLQPSDEVAGVTRSTCIQGEKGRNYPSDVRANGSCFLSTVSHACLLREYDRYPTGHYCTRGPNSNTFVGHIARACGETRVPTARVPGWNHNPPPPGTYAPSRNVTLVGCSTISCEIGESGELEPTMRTTFEPRYLGGGAHMDERGIITQGPGPKF